MRPRPGVLPTEGPRPPFCRQRVRWTHKQCLAVKTRFTPISICMQRIRCANGCVCLCLCLCVCVCVCDSGRRTSATWSWRLASRRGPQPDRMCSLLAARVATWTAARQNVFSPGGSRRDVDRSRYLGLPCSKCMRGSLWPPSQVHTQ